jgi:hypothetical protein
MTLSFCGSVKNGLNCNKNEKQQTKLIKEKPRAEKSARGYILYLTENSYSIFLT